MQRKRGLNILRAMQQTNLFWVSTCALRLARQALEAKPCCGTASNQRVKTVSLTEQTVYWKALSDAAANVVEYCGQVKSLARMGHLLRAWPAISVMTCKPSFGREANHDCNDKWVLAGDILCELTACYSTQA
eukprot:1148073-Pelagomonas_calceolata.AAC.9